MIANFTLTGESAVQLIGSLKKENNDDIIWHWQCRPQLIQILTVENE
jgi:hypothetical protein